MSENNIPSDDVNVLALQADESGDVEAHVRSSCISLMSVIEGGN